MVGTKETACKSDSSGKLTQVTFDKPNSTSTMDKPSTYQDPQEQPVQPNQLDIDPMDTQQPAAKVPGDATVNPKAAQGEEDVVEIEQKAAGEKEATASPFTSQPTHKHKATNDDGDEE